MYAHEQHQVDQPILDVSKLTVRYEGRIALENVSFHLHAGVRVAVVGPNGAGKSTLFKVIAGVLTPETGSVRVYGSGPGGHICIAYLPQRSQVDWRFPVSVADVVMMGRIARLGLMGFPGANDWRLVRSALQTVGMNELAGSQIGELSGGQQQRMFIARALAQEAELMLMDEPLTGLDSPSQEGLLTLLADLQNKGVTVMVATHDLEQASNYFDSILLLNHQLIGFGSASEVLRSDVLLKAYGRGISTVNGKVITDTCCEGDDHVHAH